MPRGTSRRMKASALQAMRIRGRKVQVVDLLQRGDPFQRFSGEGRLALEAVQHHALEQVAEGHVLVLGERLEDLEDPLLHADTGLDALDALLPVRVHAGLVPSRARAFAT